MPLLHFGSTSYLTSRLKQFLVVLLYGREARHAGGDALAPAAEAGEDVVAYPAREHDLVGLGHDAVYIHLVAAHGLAQVYQIVRAAVVGDYLDAAHGLLAREDELFLTGRGLVIAGGYHDGDVAVRHAAGVALVEQAREIGVRAVAGAGEVADDNGDLVARAQLFAQWRAACGVGEHVLQLGAEVCERRAVVQLEAGDLYPVVYGEAQAALAVGHSYFLHLFGLLNSIRTRG